MQCTAFLLVIFINTRLTTYETKFMQTGKHIVSIINIKILEIHFEGHRKLSEIKTNSLSKLEYYILKYK